MIRKDGLIKLMDFGIAQVLDFQRMTVTGQLLGSPAYMAPEIIEGKPLDFRTDVFSVGIMLYLLATGELPFAGKNPHEVLRRIAEGKFADPRTVGRGVDQVLARIITRALARRPDDRYPDVGPMGDDLVAYLGEAGLRDVRAELRNYFADPAGYDADAPGPALAPASIGSADAHLVAGRRAKAMELWNRVLAFDPANAAVTAALRRLEGRRRLRYAAAAVALGAVVGGRRLHGRSPRAKRPACPGGAPPPAWKRHGRQRPRIRRRPPRSRSNPPRRSPPRPSGRPLHGQRTPTPRLAWPRPRSRAPQRTGRRAPSPSGPTPQNVDVYLDGKRQFAYAPDHTTIAVPWSSDHVLELRSPSGCCFVERVDIGPDHPLPPDAIIARRLKWRPAHLLVTTEPAVGAARVLVSDPNRKVGATAGRPGEEIDVPFFPDDDSSKEIEVAVEAGDAFATEKIRVRAGQRLTHVVRLKAGAAPE